MAADTPADFTASIVSKFRQRVHELPSSYCRRRFVDVALLRRDLEARSGVMARLTEEEGQGVLAERTYMLMKCIVSPEKPPQAPYLYNPKEAAAFAGGIVERQRALEAKLKPASK